MPSGLSNLVTEVQQLMAELPFVQNSYGRAYSISSNLEERLPAINAGTADYKDMLPTDLVDSFSFIYIPGKYHFEDYDPLNTVNLANVEFHVIFFGDLRKLGAPLGEIITSEYIEETVSKLSGLSGGMEIDEIYDQCREVYNQFSMEVESRFFEWPFSLFRLKCKGYFEIGQSC